MKKLLISFLTVLMGLTLAFGLVACGGDDAETAKKAINTVKTMYASDKVVETPSDYTVIGQSKVGDVFYDITWSAKSDAVSNISDYVTIGTELDANKQITIGIKRSTEDIDYTLTATIKVGSASESVDFAKRIPAGEDRGDVETKTVTLSFTNASTRTSWDANSQVWEQNGVKLTNTKGSTAIADYSNPARFYKGSTIQIEFPGIIHIDFHSQHYDDNPYRTYLKDSLSAAFSEAKIEEDEDNNVVSLELTAPTDVLTFTASAGQIRLYSIDVEGIPGGASDAQKVAAAKTSLKLSQVSYFEPDTVSLPTEEGGATLTWALKNNSDYVSLSGNTLSVNSLPASGTSEISLVATLRVGDATDTKELTITLKPTPALTHSGTASDPYTTAETLSITNLVDADGYYSKAGVPKLVHTTGYVIATGTWSANFGNWTNVYLAGSPNASKDSPDAIMVYRLKTDGTYLKAEGDLQVGAEITVCGFLQNYKGNTPEISYFGDTNVTATSYSAPSDDKQIENALAALEATFTVSETGSTALPASTISAVSFAWAVKAGSTLPAGITLTGNTLNVTALPATDTEVVFTVTATCGTASAQTKDVTVLFKAEGAAVEGFTPITAPAAGSDYYLAMDIKGTWYYSTGAKSGNYLGTTTDISKAAKVTLAASGSGWTLVTNGKYIEFETSEPNVQGKTYVNIMLKDAQTAGKVWMWNTQYSVFTMEEGGETYFMGTYGKFNTFNSAKLSFIEGDDEYIGKIGTYGGTLPAEPELPEGETRATVSIEKYAADHEWENSQGYGEIVIDSNITVTATGTPVTNETTGETYGLNTGKYYSNGQNWRIYQNENPILTIAAKAGCVIVSVKITYKAASNGVLVSADKATEYSSAAVISVNAGTVSFTVAQTTATDKANGNIQISEIEVIYTGGETDPDTPAEPELDHAGTEADPLSAADVMKLFGTLTEDKAYYMDGGAAKLFWIKGYVTDFGKKNGTYGLKEVKLADVAGDDANSVLLYTANWGILPSGCELVKGDLVVITGYLQRYNSATYEITNSSNSYPEFKSIVSALTASEEVERAKTSVTIASELKDDFDLPTPTRPNVSYTWTSGNDAVAKVENGRLTITRGAADQEVTITLSIVCGEAEDSKTFTVTVKADDPNAPVLTATMTFGSAGDMQDGASATEVVFAKDGFTFTSKKAGSTSDNRTSDTDHYRLYKDSTFEVSSQTAFKKLVFVVSGTSYAEPLENSLKAWTAPEGVTVTVVSNGTKVTVEFSQAITTLGPVTLTAQVRVTSLEIYTTPAAAAANVAPVAILPSKKD